MISERRYFLLILYQKEYTNFSHNKYRLQPWQTVGSVGASNFIDWDLHAYIYIGYPISGHII